MQPYLFPYIGYWQLINAVDKFVLLDDVNFIKRGWINRNNILINGQAHLFSIPLKKPSQNKLIMETRLNWLVEEKNAFLKMIESVYKKAPFFQDCWPVLNKIVSHQEEDVTSLVQFSVEEILRYLRIEKPILRSSAIPKDPSLRAQARIIAICKYLQATHYINPIGGQSLYLAEDFAAEHISLHFIQTGNLCYKQFKNDFVPNLSIIDVMMFNSVPQIQQMLNNFKLL